MRQCDRERDGKKRAEERLKAKQKGKIQATQQELWKKGGKG